jgi:hypothetical protein
MPEAAATTLQEWDVLYRTALQATGEALLAAIQEADRAMTVRLRKLGPKENHERHAINRCLGDLHVLRTAFVRLRAFAARAS